jgi:hypothetical protein
LTFIKPLIHAPKFWKHGGRQMVQIHQLITGIDIPQKSTGFRFPDTYCPVHRLIYDFF